MALADILQAIASQKEAQITEIKESQVTESKKLVEQAEEEGKSYSANRFKEFESLREEKELKYDSEIARKKRIAVAQFQNNILDKVFDETEKKLSSLSEEELISLCSRFIRSINDNEGVIRSKGTDIEILKKSVSSAEKSFSVESGEGDGGFEFIGDGYSVDFSFYTLVHNDLRTKYEADLFAKIFA